MKPNDAMPTWHPDVAYDLLDETKLASFYVDLPAGGKRGGHGRTPSLHPLPMETIRTTSGSFAAMLPCRPTAPRPAESPRSYYVFHEAHLPHHCPTRVPVRARGYKRRGDRRVPSQLPKNWCWERRPRRLRQTSRNRATIQMTFSRKAKGPHLPRSHRDHASVGLCLGRLGLTGNTRTRKRRGDCSPATTCRGLPATYNDDFAMTPASATFSQAPLGAQGTTVQMGRGVGRGRFRVLRVASSEEAGYPDRDPKRQQRRPHGFVCPFLPQAVPRCSPGPAGLATPQPTPHESSRATGPRCPSQTRRLGTHWQRSAAQHPNPDIKKTARRSPTPTSRSKGGSNASRPTRFRVAGDGRGTVHGYPRWAVLGGETPFGRSSKARPHFFETSTTSASRLLLVGNR